MESKEIPKITKNEENFQKINRRNSGKTASVTNTNNFLKKEEIRKTQKHLKKEKRKPPDKQQTKQSGKDRIGN
jgi:hypothetical protein